MERSCWPKNLSSSRKHAIQDLLHAQNPMKKFRNLFDAHSQTGNNTGQPLFAEHLVINSLGSFSNTQSLSSSAESDEVLQVLTNACVRSEESEGSESVNTPLLRNTSDAWIILDQNLIDDGQQCRTYSEELSIDFEFSGGEMQITEALKLQMEVQRRLHEQLEVQWKLQEKLDAQNKSLKAIIEEQLKMASLEESDPANLEGARAQRADFNLAISHSVDPAREGGGVGGERNNSNISNMMMGTKEEMYEREGHRNRGSAFQTYEGEAATLAGSSSNPPQLFLDSPTPGDDCIPLSFNTSRIAEQGHRINTPVFFDFLSVIHEQ